MIFNLFRDEKKFSLAKQIITGRMCSTQPVNFVVKIQAYNDSPLAMDHLQRANQIFAPVLAARRVPRNDAEVNAEWTLNCPELDVYTLKLSLSCDYFRLLKRAFGEGVEIRVTLQEPTLQLMKNPLLIQDVKFFHDGGLTTRGMRVMGARNCICEDTVFLPMEWKNMIKKYERDSNVVEMTFSSKLRVDMSTNGFHTSILPERVATQCRNVTSKVLLETGLGADITLTSNEGTPFRCHKEIISASSEKFKEQLGNCTNLNLDASDAVMQHLLNFIYLAEMQQANEDVVAKLKILNRVYAIKSLGDNLREYS